MLQDYRFVEPFLPRRLLAWKFALGGFAGAHEYAVGGAAFAVHANDLVAKDYFAQNPLFTTTRWVADHSRWFLLLALLPIIQVLRRRRKTGVSQ